MDETERTVVTQPVKEIRRNRQYLQEDLVKALDLIQKKELGLKKASQLFNIPLSTLKYKLRQYQGVTQPVREYGKHQRYLQEDLVRALDLIKKKELSVAKASRHFNIPVHILRYRLPRGNLEMASTAEQNKATELNTNKPQNVPQSKTENMDGKKRRNVVKQVKGKYNKYTREALARAIEVVQKKEMGVKNAACKFGIPFGTLRTYIARKKRQSLRKTMLSVKKKAKVNELRMNETQEASESCRKKQQKQLRPRKKDQLLKDRICTMTWRPEDMKKALGAIATMEMTPPEAAKAFHIPLPTIYSRIQKKNQAVSDKCKKQLQVTKQDSSKREETSTGSHSLKDEESHITHTPKENQLKRLRPRKENQLANSSAKKQKVSLSPGEMKKTLGATTTTKMAASEAQKTFHTPFSATLGSRFDKEKKIVSNEIEEQMEVTELERSKAEKTPLGTQTLKDKDRCDTYSPRNKQLKRLRPRNTLRKKGLLVNSSAKKCKFSWGPEDMKKALSVVATNKMKITEAAETFHIPLRTLYWKINREKEETPNKPKEDTNTERRKCKSHFQSKGMKNTVDLTQPKQINKEEATTTTPIRHESHVCHRVNKEKARDSDKREKEKVDETRKRKYKVTWNREDMEKAVRAVVTKQMKRKEAAKVFGIPRSTLGEAIVRKQKHLRELSGEKTKDTTEVCLQSSRDSFDLQVETREEAPLSYPSLKSEVQQQHRSRPELSISDFRLSDEEEDRLLSYATKVMEVGYGKTNSILKKTAAAVARANGQTIGDQEKWLQSFQDRHPQLLEQGSKLFTVPSRGRRRKETLDLFYSQYFERLTNGKEGESLYDQPRQIFSVEEVSINLKDVQKMINGHFTCGNASEVDEKGITVLTCVSASGECLPPMFVYRNNEGLCPDGVVRGTQDGALCEAGTCGNISPEDCYLKWFDSFFLTNAPKARPLLLLLNAQTADISLDFIDCAQGNSVILFCHPSDSTHTVEPLDLTPTGVIKEGWGSTEVASVISNPREPITCQNIETVFNAAWKATVTPEVITEGFKRAGLCPFDTSLLVGSPRVFILPENSPCSDDSAVLQGASKTSSVDAAVSTSSSSTSYTDDCQVTVPTQTETCQPSCQAAKPLAGTCEDLDSAEMTACLSPSKKFSDPSTSTNTTSHPANRGERSQPQASDATVALHSFEQLLSKDQLRLFKEKYEDPSERSEDTLYCVWVQLKKNASLEEIMRSREGDLRNFECFLTEEQLVNFLERYNACCGDRKDTLYAQWKKLKVLADSEAAEGCLCNSDDGNKEVQDLVRRRKGVPKRLGPR